MRKKLSIHGLGFDTIALAITRVCTMLFGIFTTKILSNFLSLDMYGSYSQALLVTELVTSLTIFGLTDACNFFYNSNKSNSEKHTYVNTIFAIEFIVGTIGAVTIVSLMYPLSLYFKNIYLMQLLWIVAFLPLIDNLIPMLNVLYISNGKSKIIALRNFLYSLVKLICIFLICYFSNRIELILAFLTLSGIIEAIIFWILYSKIDFKINPFKWNRRLIGEILKFSLPLALYILINSLLRLSDKLFLGYFLSVEDMAIYSNAARLLPFDIIVSSLVTVISPMANKLIQKGDEMCKLRNLIKTFLSLGFASVFIFSFGALFFTKDLMVFLFDDKYIVGKNIFFVYILVEINKFCALFMVLMAYKRNKELVILALSELIGNIILNFLFYFLFGSIGCAISTLIVTTFNSIYLIARTINLTQSKVSQIIDWKSLSICLASCGISIVLPACLRYLVYDFNNSFINLLVYYSIYFLMSITFSFFTMKSKFCKLNEYRY